MKKIFSFAALAAMLLSGVSCQKQTITPVTGGEMMKTVTVSLGDVQTRASSALAGEGAIEDATLFVWQHNAKTDETILYQKSYAEASSFEFSLLFSDQTEYTYQINAWANMGELSAEPADGEILFSNEEATGLQMKGSKSGINQASASSVTIDMKRYVGKITVAEVALEWTNEQNALQDFTLKSIYVANAGDKAEGATAAYNNVSGAYASSAMDAMLYSPVNSVIADGASYSTAQMMYAYGSGSTAIVLECDLGGQVMYYHVPYEPEWNTHRAFSFTIRQAGADSPLCELPEESIEVNVTTLNVLNWDADEQETDFGEKPAASSIPYLTFSAAGEQDVTLMAGVVNGGESSFIPDDMEYSVGGGEWTAAVLNTPVSFGGTKGDLRFRAKSSVGTSTISGDLLNGTVSGEAMNFSFGSDEPVSCSGDIRTLVDWENHETVSTTDAQFAILFVNCTSLISAPNLPATELADYCYLGMFNGCTSLKEAPDLPATELADYCYGVMFDGCTSLDKAPELPATTLADDCYNNMFYGCTSLKEAPELPATELAERCYKSMFEGCASLSYIKMLATDISATGCLNNWVSGVSATGTFVKSADATWDIVGVNGVPEGWNVEVATPVGAYVYDVNGNFYTASE